MFRTKITTIFSLFLLLRTENINGFLVYPEQSTSLGLTASVSVPISEYFPERRMLWDWCLAMGYSLPSSLSQFYNVPIWPMKSRSMKKRDMDESVSIYSDTIHNIYEKYKNDTLHLKRHPTDFTAGELYQGIEDFLVTYGFHETCLLRTVCELSHHPFDDKHQNVVTEIVTFLLTPSLHEGFDESEKLYREVYEDAESKGFYGEDCEHLYPDCHKDLLMVITEIMFPNE